MIRSVALSLVTAFSGLAFGDITLTEGLAKALIRSSVRLLLGR
jgi:hypothetical protein